MFALKRQKSRKRAASGISPIGHKRLSLTLVGILVAGCVHEPPQPCNPSAPAARIIVKFADASRSAPENLQVRIPDGTSAALHHERAMSGKAELYKTCATQQRVTAIIRALSRRPGVRYADADLKLRY